MNNIVTNTFQEAFCELNQSIVSKPEFVFESRIGNCFEKTALQYTVLKPETFRFENESIGRLDYNYAELFYDWMITGCVDDSRLLEQYPNVSKFLDKPKSDLLPKNFNTFYGPRILEQLPIIIKELTDNPNSRRAVISILDAKDLALLGSSETLEFPCCNDAIFYIRNNKLNVHVSFRSQNVGQVLKLDMYLFGRLFEHISNVLNVERGHFKSTITSAHVFEKDLQYLFDNKIISREQRSIADKYLDSFTL